jgi:metallophosphoesterase (TIGR03767 family)
VRRVTRREFLKLVGGAAAAVPLSKVSLLGVLDPEARAEALGGGLTTLDQTIVKGALVRSGPKGSYYRLTTGPGERWIVREELGRASSSPIRAAASFVHFTDIHLIDAQSPGRVEFLDRFADQHCESFPLSSAFRPQETLTLHVLESMIRRMRGIRRGPTSGSRLSFAMCTGDNIDNEQFNELRWFIELMDGGRAVMPNSGGPGYEGVQAADWDDPEYWHPDAVADKYKDLYGFPEYPGLLADAVKPFTATGIQLPWLQTFGNHDGLMQGNGPRNEAFNAVAVGPLKFDGPPPGIDPCNPFPGLGSQWLPTRPVAADANRRIVRRGEYIEQHFHTSGTPAGHGFTERNRADGTAYYVRDEIPRARLIMLDTVNPGGYADGSIGAAQFAWLEERLIEVHSAFYDSAGNVVRTGNSDRLVILFSHHGLRSLVNPVMDPNPDDPGSNDLPRILADQVEALLHRFPNVIAWVNGHTHDNVVQARPDPAGRTTGFWDIGTAAHVDWNCQSRIVEVAIRDDRTISIFCTMVDHAAPADPRGATGLLRLASIHRELAANDYQYGFGSTGPGKPEDRNVELILPGPPWLG